MERKCFRCNKTIKYDDFVCPHCGAIIGDPISYSAAAKSAGHRKNKRALRWMAATVLILTLIAAACVIVWFLRSLNLLQTPTATVVPTTVTRPTPPQTTAPLSVYTARIKTDRKTDLTGAMAHVYLGDQLVYSGEIDKNGDVTFILPESEGYSIRLTELPVQYQVNYFDVAFPFADGERYLLVTLEEKPVPYTIKAVNTAGEPLPGTGITFYSSGEEPQQQVTDENGYCTFMANYAMGNCSAYVLFAPNGYVPGSSIGFGYNTLEAEITLWTYQEVGVDSEHIRTVRVVDEYGDPVSNLSLSVNGSHAATDGPSGIHHSGVTNMEGCFCFAGGYNLQWEIKIMKNADYHDTVFRFEEGAKELLIQLDLHKTPGTKYTYTVTFMDHADVPIAGVKIAYQPPDSSEAQIYTSDENGIITFQTIAADPSEVKYRITSVPDGYYTNRPDDALYGFLTYERSNVVRLLFDGHVDYTVMLMDDAGSPVRNARVYLWENGECIGLVYTDDLGIAIFRTEPGRYFEFTIDQLPEPYTNYAVDKIERYGERIAYITIVPPSDPKA